MEQQSANDLVCFDCPLDFCIEEVAPPMGTQPPGGCPAMAEKGEIAASQKAYYQANKAKIAASQKAYSQTIPQVGICITL